jgi:hypothetical protein
VNQKSIKGKRIAVNILFSSEEAFFSSKEDFSESPILPRDPLLTDVETEDWKKKIRTSFYDGLERHYKKELYSYQYGIPS